MPLFCPLSLGVFHCPGTSVLGKFGRCSGTPAIRCEEWNDFASEICSPLSDVLKPCCKENWVVQWKSQSVLNYHCRGEWWLKDADKKWRLQDNFILSGVIWNSWTVAGSAGERWQDAALLTLFPCFMICTSDAGILMFQHTPVPSRKTVPQPLLIILKIKFSTILYIFNFI